MSQAAITIGSKVRVTRVRDRIPADLVAALQADASATVTDFK
ncbi:MAG: cytochrome b6f subunit family protein, partial [Cyanobacteriota bacterium]